MVCPSFWLDEYLVSVLVCKPVDLVFYAGAVARSFALDRAIEHGALVEVMPLVCRGPVGWCT